MAALADEVDVAVIGAGAAGVAAARRLAAAPNVSVVVLEARERAGGRAWTVGANDLPMDLGCEWLHSANRNMLTPLAAQLGFSIDKKRPGWTTRLRHSGESKEAEADWLREREAHNAAMHRAAQEAEDQPASSVLVPGGRWNMLLNAISTWINGVELESLSVKDNDCYEDSGINWRMREGYGSLFTALAAGLPIAFRAAASRIDHRGRRIRVVTGRGTVTAAHVIVTVPTTAIADEDIKFDPPLPEKVAAASGLPLGTADKLFLAYDGDAAERYLIGSTTRLETMSYQLRPFGRPRINCFFGGRFAAQLERDGIAAMTAFAVDELAALCGAAIRRQLRPLAASFWRQDPFSRGSYSYARPGHADDRVRLATPVDDRLFFAGEATSRNFFTTAHGAYETGIAAAEAVLSSLTSRTTPARSTEDRARRNRH